MQEESEKVGFKLNFPRTKIMTSSLHAKYMGKQLHNYIRSDQIRSVAQLCLTLCDPMNRSTPGLPVHHQLQEFTQTHVHWVSDAIQPPHPLSSPSPPTFSLSGTFLMSQLFPSGGPSIRTSAWAPVLPVNIHDWFPLGLTGFISLQSKGLSRVFSNITVQKHQIFDVWLSLWFNSHIHAWLLEKT